MELDFDGVDVLYDALRFGFTQYSRAVTRAPSLRHRYLTGLFFLNHRFY